MQVSLLTRASEPNDFRILMDASLLRNDFRYLFFLFVACLFLNRKLVTLVAWFLIVCLCKEQQMCIVKDYISKQIQKQSLIINTFFKLISIEECALNNTSIPQEVCAVACFDGLCFRQ